MSTSSLHASRARVSPTTLVLAFIAGALAVPVFHQILFLVLHLAGIIPVPPFDMTPTKPFGVPALVSISFWGAVWGVVFALTLPRWLHGTAYWAAELVAGDVAMTRVYMLLVGSLQREHLTT